METPQFTNKHNKDGMYSPEDYILNAPKKNQTKKTLAIKKNMIIAQEIANTLGKLDFNSSPIMNQFIFNQARLFQSQSSPKTPQTKNINNNIFESLKESTIVQSYKRKQFPGDDFMRDDEQNDQYDNKRMYNENNKCCTEKKQNNNYSFLQSNSENENENDENEKENNRYYSELVGKKLKPLLPFRSCIKFTKSSTSNILRDSNNNNNNNYNNNQQQQPLFNVFRDKDIHKNISSFNSTFKRQSIDQDCSTDDENAQDQIQTLTESLLSVLQENSEQSQSSSN